VYALIDVMAPDGTSAQSVSSVTNSGTTLTWALLKRENGNGGAAVGGSAEVWWAYNAASNSMAITANFARTSSFTGSTVGGYIQPLVFTQAASNQAAAATTSGGTSTGAFDLSLTTTANNSWVWGTAQSWANNTVGTPGSTQNNYSTQAGTATDFAVWTQRQDASTPTPGTVHISISAPVTFIGHAVAFEVLPANNVAFIIVMGVGSFVTAVTGVEPLNSPDIYTLVLPRRYYFIG
jgi:hypothetical protein